MEQKAVFNHPENGLRKVVVSTNIAETSITIDDVIYVIDAGRVKENRYDHEKNMAQLVETWVSLASAKQRRGRAGRVQPGICYHLFSTMTKEVFFRMMRRIMPQNDIPFKALGWAAQIHPVLFVHRVEGLDPGAYILIRDDEDDVLENMKSAFSDRFVWTKVEDSGLPLYLLVQEDIQKFANTVSCHQDIGSDGCFSIGMLSEMTAILDKHGAGALKKNFPKKIFG